MDLAFSPLYIIRNLRNQIASFQNHLYKYMSKGKWKMKRISKIYSKMKSPILHNRKI